MDEPIHWRGKYHVGSTNVQKRVFQEFGDRSMVENPNAMYHGKWKYIPGTVKDYINFPKLNNYQSLHTTVLIGNLPSKEK